jgi:hypothetical protein
MRPGQRPRRPALEALEGRELLATFTVTDLGPAGAGTLREAILRANAAPGPDTVAFAVAGTVRVGADGLPAIRDRLDLDGASAPGYAGTPVVTVDFDHAAGLRFAAGSDGSAVRSLGITRARGAGLTLEASRITVQGNAIGNNGGDGVRVLPASRGNLIGDDDPVSGIDYYDASGVSVQPVSGWQGIRAGDDAGTYLLTGTSGANGLLYEGPLSGVGGTSYLVQVPGASSTSVYGPDNLGDGRLRLVGSYRVATDDLVRGFFFQGTTADLPGGGQYRTIAYPGAQFTYAHSVMGNLVVGNADGPGANLPIGTGHAWLYDIARDTLLPDIVYPGSTTTTAYGIWDNGGGQYTIAGGFSGRDGDRSVSRAFLVDYDAASATYSHWTAFAYPNGVAGQDYITHFEGISGAEKGVYTLVADSVQRGSSDPAQGSFVTVRRLADGSFRPADASWVDLDVPGGVGISSANSVAGDAVVGIVIGPAGTESFQAAVNQGFRLSNVISGNRGSGVVLDGSSDNRVAMNFLGTDPTGTLDRGNGGHGIWITRGASGNVIGGQATAGNDPTAGVFARPPLGNLISANRGDGVRIDRGAHRNLLSGNFIGTTADGIAALGNRGDGVAIVGANDNALIGCTFQQDPFVFYNVISGNGQNGVRVHDSNGTLIQANFLGAGANNASVVPNGRNGLLVSGRSQDTLVGGLIPLGNVISGNTLHGIEVRDRAGGFTSYNTFAGTFAFGGAAPNGGDGLRITASGANNLALVNVFSGNRGNGIAIGGHANGVTIVEAIAGLDTGTQAAIPNGGSGIRVGGHARNTRLGGPLPANVPGGQPVSDILPVIASANRNWGIEVTDGARGTLILGARVGTNVSGTDEFGNGLGGIRIGRGTTGTTIGAAAPRDRVEIAFNRGDGLRIDASRRNRIQATLIAGNLGYGLVAVGDSRGTVVRDTALTRNLAGNVNLGRSRGVVYIPVV